MAADPATGGYWLVAADGGIFAFGAPFLGSTGATAAQPARVGMAATPAAGLLARGLRRRDLRLRRRPLPRLDGRTALDRPVVGMAADTPPAGYWLVASDGGIFTFDAPFYGGD